MSDPDYRWWESPAIKWWILGGCVVIICMTAYDIANTLKG